VTLTIVTPSDAQLDYVADLCRKQSLEPPQAIHSSQEASEIISAIRTGTYDPERYCLDADLPEALRR
jgi:hypothetical protein